MKQSIGLKIFGLAVVLLLLTIALAAYLYFESDRNRREIDFLVTIDLPLYKKVAAINEYGLRRRLAFERWFGALNSGQPNQAAIAEASANYEKYSGLLDDELRTTLEFMDRHSDVRGHAPEFVEARTLIQRLAPAYQQRNLRQRELLDMQLAGRHDEANRMLNVLGDSFRQVQEDRQLIRDKIARMTESVSAAVAERQQRVRTLAIAATIATVALGLLIAALITRRLTQPVRSLIGGVRAVQGGDLGVEVPKSSTDEIGTLTDSFNYFVRELRAKEQIKTLFGRYIDPRIVDQVLVQPGNSEVSGERREMSVLFADLVGFTSLFERVSPALMVGLLNRHFGLQAEAIQEQHGIVDKFIGDAVMAFWGPPFVDPAEHPAAACRAALGQVTALARLRREAPEITGLLRDAPQFELRIGIATGDVVVGNIGSESTRNYTVIGDTVNLASRIEAANRHYGTTILLADSTARAVEAWFELREIDTIAVKGKSASTAIHELLAPVGQLAPEDAELRRRYAAGLAAYRVQAWDQAEIGFRACLELRGSDGPAAVMLDRIARLRKSPPPADWDSVYRMEEK